MDADFYKEVLEENKEAVKQKVKEAMLDAVTRKFSWEVPEQINSIVSEFITEEIAPALRDELMENKNAIVESATTIVSGIPAELGKALQEHLAKNFTDSWKLRKVTEAMFG